MGWFKATISTLRSFYSDGWGLLGTVAPLVSIAGAVLKFYGIAPMSGLSWAWLLLPITIWIAVAYIRRRNSHTQLLKRLNPELQVKLGPPWLSMVALNAPVPVDVNIINDSETQITDVKLHLIELRNRKQNSYQPLNIQILCGPINQGDHEQVRLGVYFHPDEDVDSEFVRLIFERDERWVALEDENELTFSVSANGVKRRLYKIDLDCEVKETQKVNQKRRRMKRIGFPELIEENVPWQAS